MYKHSWQTRQISLVPRTGKLGVDLSKILGATLRKLTPRIKDTLKCVFIKKNVKETLKKFNKNVVNKCTKLCKPHFKNALVKLLS